MQAVGFVKFELGQIAILRQLHPRDVQTLLPVEWSRLAIQSQPAENGAATILNYQQVGETRYFDAAGFAGKTVGLTLF